MLNINNPTQAQKLFDELDPSVDPFGMMAIRQVDFR